MSHAGKEILLKAVIHAIPTYTMSVFQLPKTLSCEINTMMGKFWWGHKENDHKIAWMGWNGLGKSKDSGGLEYRELDCFNMALLAKQGWRLLQQPETLAQGCSAKNTIRGDVFWILILEGDIPMRGEHLECQAPTPGGSNVEGWR